MVFYWLIHKLLKDSINAVDSQCLTVKSITPFEGTSSRDLFNWDPSHKFVLVGNSLHNITITFSKPITIMKYQLQVPYATRFLTGWNIEASYDGSKFTQIDTHNENFCYKIYDHDDVKDCGELTQRIFDIPLTTAKSFKLVMTKQDSGGTYQMEFSGIDFYISSPNHDFICASVLNENYLSLSIITSLFFVSEE